MSTAGQRLHQAFKLVAQPAHLRRTALVALLVGSWLTLVNLGDLLLAGPLSSALLIKVILNYLTPFVVANLGLLSHQTEA